MARELDDGEFWLPPQFLTDDDILMDFRAGKTNCDQFFGTGNGFGSFAPNSDLSSPVESLVGSTETESDEEDYLAGLTRKMAHSSLGDDLWKTETGLRHDNSKSWAMATSPQSTLCNVLGSCGCKQGSGHGSPNCSSPPATVALNRNEAAWDLLYAAAGEVAKMRMSEEDVGYYPKRVSLCPPRKPSPISVPIKNPNTNFGFHSSQSLSYHQLQAAQFQQLKQQQMMKQSQIQQQIVMNRARNSSSNGRSLGLSPSPWPTMQQSHQQQPGSGMRAVFLGNPGTKRECTGTGVFLPRRAPTETRKKPGCSTVLLPDRVVQALNLNLNLEAKDAQSPQFQPRNGTLSPDYDTALKYRNSVIMAQQRRNVQQQQPVMNSELRLPQEWTY